MRLPDGLSVLQKELVVVLLLVTISAFIIFLVANQRAFLNFFYIPILLAAYHLGKRYAVLSGLLSAVMVAVIAYFFPSTFSFSDTSELYKWLDIATWASFLLISGYCMGALYDKRQQALMVLSTAESNVRKAYRMTYEIFEKSPFGIFVVTRQGGVVYANPAMLELSDESPETIFRTNVFEFLPYRTCGIADKIRAVFDGTPFFMGSVEHASSCGDKSSVRNYTGIRLEEEGEFKALVFVEDVTERVVAEREQKKLEIQFIQAQKMESMGRLAGGVAHDFNNILCAIIGYCELAMIRLPGNHPVHDYLTIVKESGERASELTRQLLSFSRKQVLNMAPVDLNSIIENAMKMLRRMIGADIEVELRMKSRIRTVLADAGQMEQVLMNLAVNARDAMPLGGTLRIETADVEINSEYARRYEGFKPGSYILLAVSDTGTGMSEEVQKKIFEPFFTTKELGKGTGLGLATVYGIVKQHNGYIYAFSELGKGTTFKTFLPACNAEPCETPEKSTIRLKSGSETVLVAEDDCATRKWVTEALKELGYRVLETSGGDDALKVCDTFDGTIDVLLTDVVMPRMNGKELAELFHKRRPGAKVIFMSGYTDDIVTYMDDLSEATFVEKPLTLSRLSQKMRETLELKA